LLVHREDGVVSRTVDQKTQPLLTLPDLQLGQAAGGDVLEREDDAVDPVVRGAIRQDPHQMPPAILGLDLAVDGLQPIQDAFHVLVDVRIAQPARDVGERTAHVRIKQVEHLLRLRRRELHPEAAIEEDRADVGGAHQILKVVVGEAELLDFDLELLVHGGQFLVDRLQFLLARLELLGCRPELFVHRL
jgi:hypothetical protein